jgi:hypothetical protein
MRVWPNDLIALSFCHASPGVYTNAGSMSQAAPSSGGRSTVETEAVSAEEIVHRLRQNKLPISQKKQQNHRQSQKLLEQKKLPIFQNKQKINHQNQKLFEQKKLLMLQKRQNKHQQ